MNVNSTVQQVQMTFGRHVLTISQQSNGNNMDEERLTVSSTSFLEETAEKQQPVRTRWLSRLLLVAFVLLPIFRKLPGGDLRNCTAFIAELPNTVYCWIEVVLVALIILLRHYVQWKKCPNGRIVRSRTQLIRLIISVVSLSSITLINIVVSGIPLGLVLRAPIAVCCSHTLFHMIQVYFKVLVRNLRYYVLMWMSIVLFWAAGDVLFSGYDLPNSENFFKSFFEVVWNLLVLQSTANFPDVGLPFLAKNIACILYFMMFLFCNTIIISNVIIANSYNAYKEHTETYELTEGLPKVLLGVLRKKEKKMMEAEAIKKMSAASRFLREIVNSTFYRLTQWVLNIVLFFVVSYHPSGLFPNGILLIMFVLTVMLSFSTLVLVFTMPIRLTIRRPFLMYDLLVVVMTLVVDIFILAENNRFNYIYPYFALLRIPHILKPVLQYLFKDELASLQYTNPGVKGSIEVQYKFTPRIIRVFLTLFIIMLQFSGIGVLLYEGLITEQSRSVLETAGLNPDYVFVNFNSTLNSFITLFALLIVNNWNSIVASFVVLTGTRLTRLYFMLFYMFGVLVAYTIVVTCIIESVVSLAERKKAQIYGQQEVRKSHSAKIKEKMVKAVRQSLATQNFQGQVNDEYLLSCIDEEINQIQSKAQQV